MKYFIEFIEIRKFGAKTDFSNFGVFRREIQIELLICSLERIIISIPANSLVIAQLYHKFNFLIYFELYLHFSKFSTKYFFPAFLANYNLGPLYKHYASCLKSSNSPWLSRFSCSSMIKYCRNFRQNRIVTDEHTQSNFDLIQKV